MNKEFLSFEQAIALKELGFDEPVIAMYKEEFKKDLHPTMYWSKDNRNSMWIEGIISAPTYSQAFRWLYYKLDIKDGIMPLDTETQDSLLKELIYKVSSKHLLV